MFKIHGTSLTKKSSQFWESGANLMWLMTWIPNLDTKRRQVTFVFCPTQKRFLPFFLNKQIDFGTHKPTAGLHSELHGMSQRWLNSNSTVRLTVNERNRFFETKQIFYFVKIKAFNLVYVQSKTIIKNLPASKNLFWPTSNMKKAGNNPLGIQHMCICIIQTTHSLIVLFKVSPMPKSVCLNI